jgi:D-alanine--D-alanine ligase
MNRFGKIGVLAGGPSNEREISLKSGRAVYEALAGKGCEAILIDVKNDVYDIISKSSIDVAFIALHGRFGEDGTVQRILEDIGLPYTGSGVEASKLALDKIATKEIFIKNGIPVPRYKVFEKNGAPVSGLSGLGWPLVVKPQFEGSSIGLSIAGDESELSDAARKAFEYGDRILVEEHIKGRELTVGVLGEKALPAVEIVTSQGVYDYEAKYEDPGTRYLVPAPIGKNAAVLAGRLGVMSHKSLGCVSFSRVDMMMCPSGKMSVLEVNTIPGMTARSLLPKAAEAAGISFADLCIRLLDDALENTRVRS